MHSAQLYDEVETLLGEDGPSTEAFQNLTYAQRIAVLMLSRGAKHTDVAIELNRTVRTSNTGWPPPTSARPSTRRPTSSSKKPAPRCTQIPPRPSSASSASSRIPASPPPPALPPARPTSR